MPGGKNLAGLPRIRMKLPENEKQFEHAVNERYCKAGFWVHHMDTNIPGFPDTMVARNSKARFIEYKYIRPSDEHLRILRFFKPTQPSQLAHMVNHGIAVDIVIYCGGLVFSCAASVEAIKAITRQTVGKFLDDCNQTYYGVYLQNIK